MTELDRLIEGYARFRRDGWSAENARWAALAEGQAPQTLVIACSDSRVDPATIFDAAPGEIFVVRNIAALVPPFEPDGGRHGVSAAIEYAVTQLRVREILVVGHEFCGGCKASLTRAFADAPPGEGGFVRSWVSLLDDARDAVSRERGQGEPGLRALEREAVRVSLSNLRTFPFVAAAVDEGALRLTGAWFGIREGALLILDDDTGTFASAQEPAG